MTKRTQIIDEFWQNLAETPVVMLGMPAQPALSEPMNAELDAAHPSTLFFFTRSDNRLVQGISEGPAWALGQFISRGHNFFAAFEGRLGLTQDTALMDRLWTNEAAAWFEGGREDPEVRLLSLEVKHLELWKVDVSLGNRLKMIFGGELDADKIEQGHVAASL